MRRCSGVVCLFLIFSCVAMLQAQTATYHLHKEASTINTTSDKLLTAGPDAASTALTTTLTSKAAGEYLIKEFETQTGVPNTAGVIPSGSTLSFSIWMRKTANVGTVFPRAKIRLNNATGTLFCTATGATALTTTVTKQTISCVTTAHISMLAADRFYLWVGVNLTGTSSTAFNGELDIEGTANGNFDSQITLPLGSGTPTITSLTPNTGAIGSSIVIAGTNFRSSQVSSDTVTFNGISSTPSAWGASSVTAPVPSGATTGPVVVTVGGQASVGATFTVTPAPNISSLSLTSGAVGSAVTINGTNFGPSTGGSVKFGSTTASIGTWTATSITTSVPSGATTGNVVVTAAGGVQSNGVSFTVTSAPSITSLSPSSGPVGGSISITGSNFGSSQGNGNVKFNGTLATSVVWNSSSSITASVPSGATTGNVVVTAAGGVASAGKPFTVVTLTGISIAPANPSAPLGNKQQFTATGNYSDSSHQDLTSTASWSSTAGAVATINSAGLATTLSQGTTTITASFGGFNAPTTLTVTPPVLASIAITPAYPAMAGGTFQQLTATGIFTDGTTQNLTSSVTWSSTATSVATISASGNASAVSTGQTTIQATSGSITGSTVLAVTGSIPLGNMVSARYGATATFLNNGLVLIAGGVDDSGTIVASAELYNPAAKTFTATGSMVTARADHTATLLNNGLVLVTGGFGTSSTLGSAELYNPATGTFAATTGAMVSARGYHAATLLNNGTVLITGGWNDSSSPQFSTEIYDPLTGKFNSGATMVSGRAQHTTTLLNSGKVLIAGGLDGGFSSTNIAEVYDPVTVTSTQVGNLTSPRAQHAATLMNSGKVLLAGGIFGNLNERVPLADLYDPASQTFTASDRLLDPRFGETSTLLENGTAILAGGFDITTTVNSTEIFDEIAGAFSAGTTLNVARSGNTATLLNDGTLLIVGGQDSNGTAIASAELYQPGMAPPAGLVSISVSPVTPTINAGDGQTLTATGTFSDTSTKILPAAVWSSSNTAVASVTNDASNRGGVFAVATGSATITACIGSICGSTVITVSAALSTPSMTSLSPTSGTVGTAVTITGTNFGTQLPTSRVLFNGVVPAAITSWATGSIHITVPLGARTGTVMVEVPGKASNTLNFTVKPLISSISPSSATPGDTITINGSGFAVACGQTSCGSITFAGSGVSNSEINWSDTAITAQVPAGTISGNVTVKTSGGLVSNASTLTIPPPSITSLTPNAAAVGSAVIIAGNNFGGLTIGSVSFNGVSASVYSWVDNGIIVLVPAGATSGNVTVTADGQTSNALAFTVIPQPAPVISSITPAAAPQGTAITITGTNLGTVQGASTVTFNGTPATPTNWSNTMIVAPVPAGSTTGNVVVTVNGQSSNGAAFVTTVLVTNLSPNNGPVSTIVDISGSSFGATQGSSTVTFNGTLATPATWSDNTILVPVPFGASTGNLVVTVNGTPSAGVLFTVPAPSITNLSPNVGPPGTSVTISGAGFGLLQGSNTVAFNGTTATTTSWNNNSITALVPAGATTGNVAVTVSGTASNGVSFTVGTPPVITNLSPTVGLVGTSIAITGTNFGASQGTSTVKFNGVAGAPTSWSNTSIAVPVPTGTTNGNVVVTVNSLASNGVAFVVGAAPSITSVSPTSGNFGDSITISGANFGSAQGASSVNLNGIPAVVSAWSGGSIVALVPAGATSGNFTVTVNGQASNGMPFTVTNPGPSLASLSPTSGPEGTSVTITGSNFGSSQGTSTVTFNGSLASPTAWSASSITVPVVAGASSGSVVVSVNGQNSNGLLFTVLRPPTISSISPNHGVAGTLVSITGANFGTAQGSNTVTFNGAPGTPTLWSPTAIVVPAPPTATAGNIVVTVNGQSSNGVNFSIPPTINLLSPNSGAVGTPVTIVGANFGDTQGTSTVFFNNTLGVPTSWSATSIVVPVPAGATSGPLSVNIPFVGSAGVQFNVGAAPNITNVSPTTGNTGTSVTISGSSFGANSSQGFVTFNGILATPTSWSDSSIVVPVPPGATSGNIVVSAGNIPSNPVAFTVPNPTPLIQTYSPNSVPAGTSVTFTGINFGATQGSSTISFSGVNGVPTSWTSTTIVVPVPVGATTGSVVVTVNGQSSPGVPFTVTIAPSITSLSPNFGAVGTAVTINGSRFGTTQGAGTVTFSGISAAVSSWSDGQITTNVPSGAATGAVVVTANAMTSNAACFSIPTSMPCIGSLSTSVGTFGMPVTISGANFGATQGGSSVTFTPVGLPPFLGTTAPVTSWSDTSITVTVPASSASAPQVFVNVSNVASNGVSFTLPNPQIASITPNVAQVGDFLTITGTNFGLSQGQSSIQLTSPTSSFGIVFATPISWSNTQIVTLVPFAAATGPVFIVVGGSLPSNGVDIAVGPSISNLSPAFGPVGTPVTISGVNFGATQATSTVTFNGVTATPTSWSNTSIAVPVPGGASTGNVIVKANGGASLGVPFTVATPPAISGVSPSAGSIGTTVTISGSNFGATQGASTVTFNGVTGIPSSWSNGSITANVPAGATTGNVVITVSGLPSNGSPFVVGPPPTIAGLSPNLGTASTVVTVTGSNFGASQGTSTITFNGAPGAPTTWSDSSITVPVPATAATGPVVVSIGNVNSNGVTFTVPTPPSITTVSPGTGGPGSSVTITGSNFGVNQGSSTVRFNGVAAAVSSWSAGSITALVPATASTGPVTVTVAGIGSNGASFTVISSGTLSGTITSSPGGTAIVGATVQLLQNQVVKASATTDGSGNYSASNVTIGAYDVQTSASGFGTALKNAVTISPGVTTTLNVSLTTPGTISGKVTRDDGITAISGASVKLFVGSAAGSSATTDTSGNYSISGLNGDSYTVAASAGGFISKSQTAAVSGGGATTANFSLLTNGTGVVRYTYDELGRLTAVIDTNGDTATYTYDDVGNIVSIGRHNSAQVSIISFTPAGAGVGAVVTINGTNFSTTPSQNTVTFNGTSATVSSATSTQIVTAVPVGATTGPISLTTPGGSATSSSNFVVGTAPDAPTISNFTPAMGGSGASVTITGTNFVTDATKLYFGGTSSTLASVTSSTIVATVPSPAASGRVNVVTPAGSTSSSQDFFVPFGNHVVADIAYTARMNIGSTQTVALSGVGRIALLIFDASAAQGINLQLSGSTFSACTIYLFDPLGNQIASSDCTSATVMGPSVTAAINGTYTIGIDPAGNAGSLNVSLVENSGGAIVVDGAPVTVSTTVTAPDTNLTFAGTTGQRVLLQVSNVSNPAATVFLVAPNGSTQGSIAINNNTVGQVFQLGRNILPLPGTYTLWVQHNGTNTGSETLQLNTVPDDFSGSMTIGGAAVPVSTVAGQFATISFNNPQTQSVSLSWTSGTYSSCTMNVTGPASSTGNVSCSGSSGNLSLGSLDPGSYFVVLQPQSAGAMNLSVTTP